MLKVPNLQIAIDGPVASGKGTIAGLIAKKLGLTYVYTGAMYRALALACLQNGVNWWDENAVIKLLQQIIIDLQPNHSENTIAIKVLLNNDDVSEEIFTPKVAEGSSVVATLPKVRRLMVALQKEMIKGKAVVMEGRDIGLRVMPNAHLKIFLTASLEERARRRVRQHTEQGINKPLEEVLKDTQKRDMQDTTRSTDPLQKLPDAWELDTTGLTEQQVTDKIIQELQKRKLI